MTITQLKYVLAVAEFKNFTLAAERSFVTQPTLSMQIQKLEEELDVVLPDDAEVASALEFSNETYTSKIKIKNVSNLDKTVWETT